MRIDLSAATAAESVLQRRIVAAVLATLAVKDDPGAWVIFAGMAFILAALWRWWTWIPPWWRWPGEREKEERIGRLMQRLAVIPFLVGVAFLIYAASIAERPDESARPGCRW